MEALFLDVKKKLRPRGGGFASVRWKFAFLLLFGLSSGFLMGQSPGKKIQKDASLRKLNTSIPKSESKLKTFDEYEEFVIADFSDGAVEDIVQEEESGSMQQEFQNKLPINTVFKTTSSKICAIGVEGAANAKMVLNFVNNKKARIIKKADLDKTLSKSNVKIITKE